MSLVENAYIAKQQEKDQVQISVSIGTLDIMTYKMHYEIRHISLMLDILSERQRIKASQKEPAESPRKRDVHNIHCVKLDVFLLNLARPAPFTLSPVKTAKRATQALSPTCIDRVIIQHYQMAY